MLCVLFYTYNHLSISSFLFLQIQWTPMSRGLLMYAQACSCYSLFPAYYINKHINKYNCLTKGKLYTLDVYTMRGNKIRIPCIQNAICTVTYKHDFTDSILMSHTFNTRLNIVHYNHNKIHEQTLTMKYMCEHMENKYRHDINQNKL